MTDFFDIIYPDHLYDPDNEGLVATVGDRSLYKVHVEGNPEIKQLILKNNSKPMSDVTWYPNTPEMPEYIWHGETHMQFQEEVTGEVLLAGLGFGWDAFKIRDKVEVTKIDIIENSADIITLIADQIAHDKITVIQDSILNYLQTTDKKYDYIWFDIFPESAVHWPEEVQILKNAAQPVLNSGGNIAFWRTYPPMQL